MRYDLPNERLIGWLFGMADQRNRILEATLGLMARQGCERHEHAGRRGRLRLQRGHPVPLLPVEARPAPGRDRAPPRPPTSCRIRSPRASRARSRIASGALLDHLFVGMTADEDLWRTLLAEAIHGDDDVLSPLLETAAAFELALAGWLRDLCPDAPALHDPSRRPRHPQRRHRRAGRAPSPIRRPACRARSAPATLRTCARGACLPRVEPTVQEDR